MTYVVDAPLAAAYRYLSDPSLSAADVAPRSTVEPAGQVHQGDEITLDGPGLATPFRIQVTELVPPTRIAFRMSALDYPDRVSEASYELEAMGSQTRVTGTMETHLPSRLEVGARLIRPLLWLQARRGNRRIAAAIVRRHRAGELT